MAALVAMMLFGANLFKGFTVMPVLAR